MMTPSTGRPLNTVPAHGTESGVAADKQEPDTVPVDCALQGLLTQLRSVFQTCETTRPVKSDKLAEAPACAPTLWINKWVDYSDKYGIGYQLCDQSVGILFNDNTKLLLGGVGEQLRYAEKDNKTVLYFKKGEHPESLQNKITLLTYFHDYMNKEKFVEAANNSSVKTGLELSDLPTLRSWFRTQTAIVFHLSNGTVQMNFFADHTKLVLCPFESSATYIDKKKKFTTYKLALLEKHGMSTDLKKRLKYAERTVERLMAKIDRNKKTDKNSAPEPTPSQKSQEAPNQM